MPLQGHWKRVNTPLRATTVRERRILVVFAAILAAGAVAAVIVALGTSSPKTPAGCIHVELPSTMGGVSSDLCGDTARQFCLGPAANSEPLDTQVQPKCRAEGYPVRAQ
jgi:hypothetical protein